MDLDELNKSVTNAILQAEALPLGSWERQSAFRRVADIEEGIATLVGAQTLEGEIARVGAVTAALSAGEPLRAIQLAERSLAGRLSDGVRAKLEDLVKEAEDELLRGIADVPNVEPVRFALRAA